MEPPRPKPKVTSLTVILTGFGFYIVATRYPGLFFISLYLLSKLIPYLFKLNDDGDTRRLHWKPWSVKAERPEAYRTENLNKTMKLKEMYWMNQRGMALMTSIMLPKDNKVKAVVCLCHGFNDNASYYKRIEYQRLLRKGIAVVTIEYEGHGRSDGLLSYIQSWDKLIDDTSQFFEEVIQEQFPRKKCFLMGESMGGAICYFTYKRNPKLWSGIVFVCPMLKLSDDLLPPEWVVNFFRKVCGPIGSYSPIGWLPLAPSADIGKQGFRLPEKRYSVCNFPCFYGRKPRLVTSRELLHVTTHISENYKSFDAPFIILHGKDDMVTDPDLSQMFYDGSISKDKELKLYDGLWHNLTFGETDETTDMIFKDVTDWIFSRLR